MLLPDMLEHARLAQQAVQERRGEDLDRDRVLLAALERFIEIIGEAASQLSEDGRQSRPDIPWPQIIAMRNRLIHGYPSVDEDIIWKVVQSNIPALIAELERELSERRRVTGREVPYGAHLDLILRRTAHSAGFVVL